MDEMPTLRLEDLSDEQFRAYAIADNKLADNAGWDRKILAVELQHLLTLEWTDFDVTITGFEVAEIDSILEGSSGFGNEDETVGVVSDDVVDATRRNFNQLDGTEYEKNSVAER